MAVVTVNDDVAAVVTINGAVAAAVTVNADVAAVQTAFYLLLNSNVMSQ